MKKIILLLFVIGIAGAASAQSSCSAQLTLGGVTDTVAKKLLTFPMGVIVNPGTENRCPDGLRVTAFKVKVVINGETLTLDCSGSTMTPELISKLRAQPAGTVFYVTNIQAADPKGQAYMIEPWSFVLK
jgi:hypothetical protein